MNKHKLGVDPNYVAKRHLNLTGSLDQNGDAMVNAIEALIGVDVVSLDIGVAKLHVHYDATQRQFDDIIDVIREHGCDLSNRRWHRSKRSWYRYFDQNMKENAAKEPWSCH